MIIVEPATGLAENVQAVELRAPHWTRRLWWEIHAPRAIESPRTLDHAAVALTPFAMAKGLPLHIRGEVHQSQLANLEEYQDLWVCWRPDLFSHVPIRADKVIDKEAVTAPPRRGVLAFSGGVDAAYSLVMHSERRLGARTIKPSTAVLIQGMDIPLAEKAGFARAATRARSMTDVFGVDLVTVRTNWREDGFSPSYTMTFTAGIFAALQLFSAESDAGIVSAGGTYGAESGPWGMHPSMDHLLGRSSFPSVTTGYGATRVDKCRAIGEFPAVRANVRVCWAGPGAGDNCGACEKCIRTQLNFLAAGWGEIPSIGPLRIDRLRAVELKSPAQVVLMREILDDAAGLPAEVVLAVQEVLDRHDALDGRTDQSPR